MGFSAASMCWASGTLQTPRGQKLLCLGPPTRPRPVDFLIWPADLPVSLASAPLGVPVACSPALEGSPALCITGRLMWALHWNSASETSTAFLVKVRSSCSPHALCFSQALPQFIVIYLQCYLLQVYYLFADRPPPKDKGPVYTTPAAFITGHDSYQETSVE